MAARLSRLASKADSAMNGRYDDTSSDEEEEMRAVPKGCLGRVGVEMMRAARAGEDETQRVDAGAYGSIVDQTQFRNLKVNEGYQAPFVVRQRTANSEVAPAAKRASAAADERPVKLVNDGGGKEKKAKKERKEGKSEKKEKKERKEGKETKKKKKKKDKESKKERKKDKKGQETKAPSPTAADGAASSSSSDGESSRGDDVEPLPPQTEDDAPLQMARFDALLHYALLAASFAAKEAPAPDAAARVQDAAPRESLK